MLDANLKTQLKQYLTRLTRPVELVASLDSTPKSAELRALLHDIAAQSDRIAVREDGADPRRPSLSCRPAPRRPAARPSCASPACRWATSSPRWCWRCCRSAAIR
jgi:alkyl hydroperoxide reductase subunit F